MQVQLFLQTAQPCQMGGAGILGHRLGGLVIIRQQLAQSLQPLGDVFEDGMGQALGWILLQSGDTQILQMAAAEALQSALVSMKFSSSRASAEPARLTSRP